MAINLLNNPIGNTPGSAQNLQTGGATGPSALMRQAAARILNGTEGLSAGDTLQGQLVSKDGSTIELLLGNNTRLTTLLEQDMNLALGQLMSFEVKSNQGGQLMLRPLFANMSNSSTIMNALDAAGIAPSDRSVNMVNELMQNGMSVNKEMLQTVNRELNMYPDADVQDIVMLHKMDIPVNESNVRQMHLYNNNNQWMMENVADSAGELTQVITKVLGEGTDSAKNILAGLKELLPPDTENAEATAGENISAGPETAGTNNLPEGNVIPRDQNGEPIQPGQNMTQVSPDGQVISAQLSASQTDAKPGVQSAAEGVQDKAANNVLQQTENAASGIEPNAKVTDNTAFAINKMNVFDAIEKMDAREFARPEVKAQIKDALTELLKDNFLMNPKDIKEDRFVQKYYERTLQLADGLERLMAENGRSDSGFARSMTGIKENTSFMNQVNDMYNYIQLPLKMNEAQANGDLYVYARKKGRNNMAEDGKLTALLHLSMEHLGNMDIFLELSEGQKLNTRFTLEKEEMIDFIASHIDELNERLKDKGYNVGTTVTHKDGPDKTVIENIVGDRNNILLSTQSFDARA